MPIYEYECLKCGEVFEAIHKRSEPPPEQHGCGSTEIRRLMSASAFILKGDGWYITDYARKDKNNGKKEKAPSSSDKGDSKGEGKSASDSSKPASKPDAAA